MDLKLDFLHNFQIILLAPDNIIHTNIVWNIFNNPVNFVSFNTEYTILT